MALLAAAAARRFSRSLRLLSSPHRFTSYSASGEAGRVPADVGEPESPVRAPPDEQFAAWVARLRPGFTAGDLAEAISSERDPDLALALFRWAALRPGFRHAPASYLAALTAASSGRRRGEPRLRRARGGVRPRPPALQRLPPLLLRPPPPLPARLRHVQQDAVPPGLRRLSPGRRDLHAPPHRRRAARPPPARVHGLPPRRPVPLPPDEGVVPDTFLLNLIIKAYARCLEIDDALKVFHEMPLYGCEANEFTYGYIVKAMFQKGRTDKGMVHFREAREKGFVPTGGVYMTAVSALALEWRFEESRKVLIDMLHCKRQPDMITFRTLLEEMCRVGRAEEAFKLLEELREGSEGH